MVREFPDGIVVRIPGFHCRGLGSISGWGTEILQAARPIIIIITGPTELV